MTDTVEAPPQQTDSLSTLILLILLLIGVFTLSLALEFRLVSGAKLQTFTAIDIH